MSQIVSLSSKRSHFCPVSSYASCALEVVIMNDEKGM